MDLVREFELVASTKTDQTFVRLMLAQWAALVGIALWLSPHTWSGTGSGIRPHVVFAVVGGGLIVILPVLLSRYMPGGVADAARNCNGADAVLVLADRDHRRTL